MLMTEEALKLLLDTAKESAREPIVTTPREPSNVYFIHNPSTDTYTRVVGEYHTNTTADTLDSVVDQALTLGSDKKAPVRLYYIPGTLTVPNGASMGAAIRAIVGHSTVLCKIPHSVQFHNLQSWSVSNDGAAFTQAQFFTALQTTFAGCLSENNATLPTDIRKFNFRSLQEIDSELTEKGASVSKRLSIQATSEVKLPEVFTLKVPVYRGQLSKLTVAIRVALVLDAEAQRIRLYVLPGEIDAALEEGAKHIESKLVSLVNAFGDDVATCGFVASATPLHSGDSEESTVAVDPVLFHIYRGLGPNTAACVV